MLWSRTAASLTEQSTAGPWYEGTRLRIQGEMLVRAGRLAGAEAVLAPEYERAHREANTELRAFIATALALVRREQGRVRAASEFAKEATGLFRTAGRYLLAHEALLSDALALALSGDAAGAARCLTTIDSMTLPPVPDVSGRLEAQGWIAVAAGDLARARDLLESSATNAQETGHLMQAAAALHGVARLGGAREIRDRLVELGASLEGDLVRARVAHVEGLAAGDAGGLEQAGQLFEELGANLYAAEAFADAAVTHRRHGESRAAAARHNAPRSSPPPAREQSRRRCRDSTRVPGWRRPSWTRPASLRQGSATGRSPLASTCRYGRSRTDCSACTRSSACRDARS